MLKTTQQADLLLKIWDHALQAVEGHTSVKRFLQSQPDASLASYSSVVAVGKAASSMMEGAIDALGSSLQRGLLITKHDHASPDLLQHPLIQVIESGHPIPDENSLLAGQELLRFIKETPPDGSLLILISGGTSSLVEVLPPGLSLQDLQTITAELLASGYTIAEMNALRKAASLIKGGKLALLLEGRPTLALAISDVPSDDPRVIGSGMLSPYASPAFSLPSCSFPIEQFCSDGPTKENPCFASIRYELIATNTTACEAAREKALELGLSVFWEQKRLEGDVIKAAKQIEVTVEAGDCGLYLWGGETTVVLPPSPGQGGRNQALALELAIRFAGRDGLSILAAGTDGTDGPTDAAGGLIHGGTIKDLHEARLHQEEANAYPYLKANDALLVTGPTGTNVMDLTFALKTTTRKD